MANTVRLKRSAVQGKAPVVGDLALGELAVNTYDGKLYTKKNDGSDSIVEIGGSPSQWTTTGSDIYYTTGSVGIGTTTPTWPLEVLGGASDTYIRVRADSADTHTTGVLFGDSNSSSAGQIRYSNANNSFRFWTSNTEQLRITSAGRIGIGTAAPNVILDIDGTDAIRVPVGTTAERPGTPENGQQRYNSDLGAMEVYVQGAWQVIANTSIDYGLITASTATTFDYGALS